MAELLGPAEPWLGILDVVGVGLALLVWFAARNASQRVRAVVAAFGAVLLFRAVVAAFNRAASVLGLTTSTGFRFESQRAPIHVLLLLAGVAAGVAAVLAAHAAAAEAGEELAEDDDADDDDDQVEVAVQRAAVSLTPWLDVLALALAIGLPVSLGPSFFGPGGVPDALDVTGWIALQELLIAFATAGALLVLTGRPEHTDVPRLAAAFGIVAVGRLLVPVFPDAFANQYWVSLAAGFVAGLVAATAVGLLARGLPGDRQTALVGSLAALALSLLVTVVAAQVTTATHDEINEQLDGFPPAIQDDAPFPTEGSEYPGP